MPYIGAGITRFNTADGLTVTGTSELKNNVTVTGDVTASGTVGIGETTPVTPLTIATTNKLGSTFTGNTNGEGLTVTQTNYTSGNYISLVEAAYDDSGDGSPNVRIGAMFDGGGSNLAFGTSNSYGSGITNTAMFIDSVGAVGIGTSSPVALLTIEAADGVMANQYVAKFTNSEATTGQNYGVFVAGGSSSADESFSVRNFDNSATYLKVRGDGNVGINTSSMSNTLQVNGNGLRLVNSADTDALHLFEFDGSNNATAALYAANGDNNVKLNSSGDSFFTGTLAVGTNSVPDQFIVFRSAGDIATVRTGRTDSSNVGMIVFKDGDNQTCGQITSRGNDNTTSYNTSSDHRLKQSVTGMAGAIDRVKALLPKRFSFINDTTNTMQDGFLAHEAQTVVPQSVIGTHNQTREVSNAVLLANGKLYAEDVTQEDWTANKGDDENDLYPSDSTWAASHTAPVYQQIDQSKLVPLLTGALQEAIAKIETLEAKVAALENAQ